MLTYWKFILLFHLQGYTVTRLGTLLRCTVISHKRCKPVATELSKRDKMTQSYHSAFFVVHKEECFFLQQIQGSGFFIASFELVYILSGESVIN